jgi:hypothetical protein
MATAKVHCPDPPFFPIAPNGAVRDTTLFDEFVQRHGRVAVHINQIRRCNASIGFCHAKEKLLRCHMSHPAL